MTTIPLNTVRFFFVLPPLLIDENVHRIENEIWEELLKKYQPCIRSVVFFQNRKLWSTSSPENPPASLQSGSGKFSTSHPRQIDGAPPSGLRENAFEKCALSLLYVLCVENRLVSKWRLCRRLRLYILQDSDKKKFYKNAKSDHFIIKQLSHF